jgi:hypothetical protein
VKRGNILDRKILGILQCRKARVGEEEIYLRKLFGIP